MNALPILAVLIGILVFFVAVSIIYHLKVNLVRILSFLFIIFIITAFIVSSDNNIRVGEDGWLGEFVTAYAGYAGQIISNIGEITGQVVKQDWLPK